MNSQPFIATKDFLKTTILGGLAVILPISILLLAFNWLFGVVTDLIQPLTDVIIGKAHVSENVGNAIALVTIVGACFIAGVFVRTRIGNFIHKKIETKILKYAPGYSTIKEIVSQFTGIKRPLFTSVALVKPFGNETQMTGFITETSEGGMNTVFVPMGLNPTSGGLIFHLDESNIEHLQGVRAEEAIKITLGCGAGSDKLLNATAEAQEVGV